MPVVCTATKLVWPLPAQVRSAVSDLDEAAVSQGMNVEPVLWSILAAFSSVADRLDAFRHGTG